MNLGGVFNWMKSLRNHSDLNTFNFLFDQIYQVQVFDLFQMETNVFPCLVR